MQNCPRILTGGNKANSRTTALDFRRVAFDKFKVLLEESHGRQFWVEDGYRRAGCFSRVTSSKVKNGPSLCAGKQPKVAQVHKVVPTKLKH